MKRNAFGDPRPATAEEVLACMDRIEDPTNVYAEVGETDEDGFGGVGWTANVMDNDSGEIAFSTCAFPDRDALVQALTQAGILDIQDREV